MKIGIVGKGFVGTAISKGFVSQGHKTICHDVRLETRITDVLDTPITYVSVSYTHLTLPTNREV